MSMLCDAPGALSQAVSRASRSAGGVFTVSSSQASKVEDAPSPPVKKVLRSWKLMPLPRIATP